MQKNKKLNFLFIVIITFTILLVLVIIFLQRKVILLEINKYPENNNLIREVVHPEEIIKTSYRHSIAKTTVWEVYEITENARLIQRETHFYDSVAGMPYAAFGDEVFLMEDGKYKIKNMNRPIDLPLYYNVGAIRENHLYIKNKEINLSELTGDQLVTINLREVSFWENIMIKIKQNL
ncbi:MAG: DUF1850 domain-containing protein [Atribacterota bacterium]